jgi:uncharacterized OsmC-like protein
MATIKTEYLGDLRTRAKHVKSGNALVTDAPIDNQGKGEAFSPSDLLVTALGSCMLTIMGIAAREHDIDLEGVKLETLKIMGTNPRRVSRVEIEIDFPVGKTYTEKQRLILEKAAKTCPVIESLHPDMEKEFKFNW